MPDDQSEAPVDKRAAAALERLRHDPALPGGAISHELFERPRWSDRLRADVVGRCPALDERPVVVGLVVVATVVALVVVAVWVATTGTGGPNDGGGGFRLPFTTVTSSARSSSGAGGDPGSGTAVPPTLTALVVHAAGAVQAPGVHRVPNGARVADVLAAAGGPTADADIERLNLAAIVSDGQRLYVPRMGEAVPPVVVPSDGSPGVARGTGPGSGPPTPVDLNQATEAELDVLPGVGPSTAAAIVAHRAANGPFRRVDDLLEVRGIGPAKLEAMRDLVRVG